MKKLKNLTLKKEIKKFNNYIYIFFIFLVLGALFIAIGICDNRQTSSSYTYLNDIIENKNNEINANAYLEVAQAPYSIAKYEDDENNAFYIVYDGRYFYIAYISDELYEKLNVEGLEEEPLTIYGTTTATPEALRQIALEAYNEGLDEDKQIEMDDFNNYFGEVYLNNVTLKKVNYAFYIISIIPFIISLIFLALFLIKKRQIIKAINQLTEKEIEKLEKEVDKDTTIFNKENHLILTDNYIISFKHGLLLIKYSDLIWVYEKSIKQYGITTAKKVFIMNKKDKTFDILNTNGEKKSNSIIKEVITTISNKNDKVLVGFNKKNEEEINEILKNS